MAVKDLYDKACEAFNKGNYDYAVELYREVLRLSPDYANARVLLRGTERRRLAERGSSIVATLVNRIKGFWPLLKARLHGKSPAKQLECCEDCLETNPSRIGALMMAGRAAAAAGYNESAIAIFKDVLSLRANHKKALRALAEAFEQAGQIKEALAALLRLAPMVPTDRELQMRIKNLQATQHMQTTGMDHAETFRDLIRDQEVAKESVRRLESLEERRAREIAQARQAVEQDPANTTKITHLALLYRREGDPNSAFKVLKAGHERMPDDYEIREQLGELQLQMYDAAVSRIEQQLQQDPDNQALKDKKQDLLTRRKKYAVHEYGWRVERHPTDYGLRMQLGKALLEVGDYNGAIAAFQNAAKDSKLQLEACCMLGRCFAAKNQFDLTFEQLHRAAAMHPRLDETGLEINYLMADALDRMGDREQALKLYKKIYASDISFRDVAEKVESLSS